MNRVTVSIDRIVIDFTDVYWDFFNEFHKRICHFLISTVTAAELIAEIGDIRRFSKADTLARFAGIAPVRFSSGGKGKDEVAEGKTKKQALICVMRRLVNIIYNMMMHKTEYRATTLTERQAS